jgi:hypothetical protein
MQLVLEFKIKENKKMKKYATLNNKVVLIEPTQEQLDELIFIEDYDTVIELEDDLSVGDELPTIKTIKPISSITLSKFQAFYSLASLGLLHKTDTLVKQQGSAKLKEIWKSGQNLIDGIWAIRNCNEVTEIINLLEITEDKMDTIFLHGSEIKVNAPKKNFTDAQSNNFDKEIRIWQLKGFLTDTDYIELPSYDQSKEDLITQRQAWREEIRLLKSQLVIL